MALPSSSSSLLRRRLLSSTPLSSFPSPSSILRGAFCSSSTSSPTPPPPSSIFGDDTEVSNVPPLTTPNLFVSNLSGLTTDEKLKTHLLLLDSSFKGKLALVVMMRGGGLMGLTSQFVWKRGFSTEIFVSRLSFYTTEEELKNVFSPFGAVEEARLVRDNQTGRPKGFGFVKYSSREEAQKAVKALDGRILRGRLIFVEIAKERSTG